MASRKEVQNEAEVLRFDALPDELCAQADKVKLQVLLRCPFCEERRLNVGEFGLVAVQIAAIAEW